MVKTIHTITIKDYSLFEKTDNLRIFCPVPWLYRKRLDELLIEITKGLGSGGSDELLEKEHWRLTSLLRLQELITLHNGVQNLLVNKIRVDKWLAELGKKPRGNYDNLKSYTDQIEKSTGIKIEKIEDLIKLKKKIDFYTEKYHEHFMQEEQKEGITFDQIVVAVFISAMKSNIDYNMPLSVFFSLKETVEKQVKKTKEDG